MPATEQTWRDQKKLHLVFGVTGVLMLISTVWMLAKDHAREWKAYQNTTAKITQFHNVAQIDQIRTVEFTGELQAAEAAVRKAQETPIFAADLERFEEELASDAERRNLEFYAAAGEEMPAELQRRKFQPFDLAEAEKIYARLAKPTLEEANRLRDAIDEARQMLSTLNVGLMSAESAGGAELDRAKADVEAAKERIAELEKQLGDEIERLRVDEEIRKAIRTDREEILAILRDAVARAKFREENILQQRKFRAADLTAALSLQGLAIGEGKPQEEIDRMQAEIDEIQSAVDDLTAQYEAANLHRKQLDEILKGAPNLINGFVGITYYEEEAEKEVFNLRTALNRYHGNIKTAWTNFVRTMLNAPLNPLNPTEIRIEQLWLPDMTINYNFSNVARFDRCITCHRLINATAPGTATEPGYPHVQPLFDLVMQTPAERPEAEPLTKEEAQRVTIADKMLLDAYGLILAPSGLLDENDVTVMAVWPAGLQIERSALAAEAGLKIGDVIVAVNRSPLVNRDDALRQLVYNVTWGEPLRLTIRRGLPHPYASHPRLDLYLTDSSPHPQGEMGCTICHDGQGSGTEFKWASHTPNNPDIAVEWYHEYGWFDNHHWIFPMLPQRFIESNCLKCHHEVVELRPSERYPDPPAPKLLAGYDLIRKYGCFGCHEINGYDGPDRRIGPDLRAEPNFHSVAGALLDEPALTEGERSWAARLVEHPEDDQVRRRLFDAIDADRQLAAKKEVARFDPRTHSLGALLKDVETPGELRQVGPSLRHVRHKLGFDFLYDWIRKPSDFRPDTRMPQFFGLWQHLMIHEGAHQAALVILESRVLERLEGGEPMQALARQIAAGEHADDAPRRQLQEFLLAQAQEKPGVVTREIREAAKALVDDAERFEPIEIRGISEYLLAASAEFDYIDPPEEVNVEPSAARGERLFQMRGCLACHSHRDFPGIQADHAPDLSRVGSKFTGADGERWLYTWLRQPNSYHTRTKMPDVFLLPIENNDGTVTDPAADIAKYLLSSGAGFEIEVEEDAAEDPPSLQVLVSGVADPTSDAVQTGDVIEAIYDEAAGQWKPLASISANAENARDAVVDLLQGRPGSTLRLQLRRAGDVSPPENQPADDAPAANAGAVEVEITRPGYQVEAPERAALTEDERDALQALALEHLAKAYPKSRALEYLRKGLTDVPIEQIKGDELALFGPVLNEEDRIRKQLLYVGRRAISKYGCFGCHEIPGYEAAKPIGTGLADWGRKNTAQLAFEQIGQYLPLHGSDEHLDSHMGAAHGHVPPHGLSEEDQSSLDVRYFLEAIGHHNRQGFLWQKLRQPRSYDFAKTENKPYNDRLRMPQFPLTAEEREAVMTFVLGLVSEPPATKYHYDPGPRGEAIADGRKVLERFNCAGCHVLEMQRWEFPFDPDNENYGEPPPPPAPDYPFLHPFFTQSELAESLQVDSRGLRDAVVIGRASVNAQTGQVIRYDEYLEQIPPGDTETPAAYFAVEPWQPTLVNGYIRKVGATDVLVPAATANLYPAWGGDLANYLYPRVLAESLRRGVKVEDVKAAWGWVPPPLVGEGEKVQPDWLHDFLLDPVPIRPSVVLRMPKFNMSSAEASALVGYFAAKDNAEYPYGTDDRARAERLAQIAAEDTAGLEQALGIVVHKDLCVTCHRVGDFVPDRPDVAPNLADVHRRLRPDYLTRWIANPKRILPYTSMPVNIPYDKGIAQSIHPGTPTEQLESLVSFLLNYDVYTQKQVDMTAKAKAAAKAAGGEKQPDTTTSGAE